MNLSDYFKIIKEHFLKTKERVKDSQSFFYSLGNNHIKLDFANAKLSAHLTKSFSHLSTVASPASDLTIHLWDSAGERGLMPPFVWPSSYWQERDSHFLTEDNRFFFSYEFYPHRFSLFDVQSKEAYFWMENSSLPWYMISSPFKDILSWWGKFNGFQVIHSAAVGTSKGGVLLGGKAGSGKSTVSLSCLRAGMLFAGDDTCMVSSQKGRPLTILSTSCVAKLEKLDGFSHLEPLVINKERKPGEKAMIYLNQHYYGSLARHMPLKAIILLEIKKGSKKVHIKKTDLQPVLSEIYGSSVELTRGKQLSGFFDFYKTAKQVPSFIMELGQDSTDVPLLISSLISST